MLSPRRIDAGSPFPQGATRADGALFKVRGLNATSPALLFAANNRQRALRSAASGAATDEECSSCWPLSAGRKPPPPAPRILASAPAFLHAVIKLCQQLSSLFRLSAPHAQTARAHGLPQHRRFRLLHCFTPPHLQGRGYAAVLARVVFEACFVAGVAVEPVCTYLTGTFLPKHAHLLSSQTFMSCLPEQPTDGEIACGVESSSEL